MPAISNQVIPFYGGAHPELFAIERRCMDRAGKVIAWLDQRLPTGSLLDIGAGNGFTADRLTTPGRHIIPLEPDRLMIDVSQQLPWTQGVAQALPFHDQSFDAVYATWAFFFVGNVDLIETTFQFDTLAEAKQLLSFYFGDAVGQHNQKLAIGYNVAIYHQQFT